MGRRRVWLTCNVVVRCPLCIEAPPRRVSPASGRDGLVFASLTCSPSGVSPQRWETGGRERRFGVRFAHSFFLCRLTPAVGDGRAGETVWCSVRSLVHLLPSLPSGERRERSEQRGGRPPPRIITVVRRRTAQSSKQRSEAPLTQSVGLMPSGRVRAGSTVAACVVLMTHGSRPS